LEINANPCLTPDAGFAAALDRAGVTYSDAIGRIIADGLARANAGSMV
jgi:D-alanine-D-alanine ligase